MRMVKRGTHATPTRHPQPPSRESRRHLSRGLSIVANTEAMTQLALAAKNDELERITAARQDLVRGVAEVLGVLAAATQADATAHEGGATHA